MIDTVAHQCLAAVAHNGTSEQFRLFSLGIIVAVFTIDVAAARSDIRRSHDMGPRGTGVIIQRVGRQVEFLVPKAHVIVEHSHLRVRMIFTPVRRQHSSAVNEFTTLEEITEGVHTVVVQRVAVERRFAVFQYHIIAGHGQLVVTVIIGIVTGQSQGVTLYHLHMSPSLKGIGLFVEMGTVAIQVGTHVTKMHAAMKNLRITVTVLVIMKVIGMNQIDTFVLSLLLARHSFLGGLHGESCSQQHHRQQGKQRDSPHVLLPHPTFVLEIAVAVALIQMDVG